MEVVEVRYHEDDDANKALCQIRGLHLRLSQYALNVRGQAARNALLEAGSILHDIEAGRWDDIDDDALFAHMKQAYRGDRDTIGKEWGAYQEARNLWQKYKAQA